jgi:hypothetical protein
MSEQIGNVGIPDIPAHLGEVGGEPAKLKEAARLGFRKAVIARSVLLGETTEAFLRQTPGLDELHAATTLDEAIEHVSGLAEGLKAYLEAMRGDIDWVERVAPYLGGRKPSEVFVWPGLLKWELREPPPDRENEERGGRGRRKTGRPWTRFEASATDISEQIYGESAQEEWETRVRWREEVVLPWLEQWKAGVAPAKQIEVILGPPGQGKTVLGAMTARLVADCDGPARRSSPLRRVGWAVVK